MNTIDPKSLRIGNWVNRHFEGGEPMPEEVTVRTIFDCQVNPTGKFSFSGIPLSEDELRRLGFKRVHGKKIKNIGLPYWAKDALLLFFNDSPPENTYLVGYGFNVGSEYYAATGRWIDTVHDLQNIYQEWKGEELTLKDQ